MAVFEDMIHEAHEVHEASEDASLSTLAMILASPPSHVRPPALADRARAVASCLRGRLDSATEPSDGGICVGQGGDDRGATRQSWFDIVMT